MFIFQICSFRVDTINPVKTCPLYVSSIRCFERQKISGESVVIDVPQDPCTKCGIIDETVPFLKQGQLLIKSSRWFYIHSSGPPYRKCPPWDTCRHRVATSYRGAGGPVIFSIAYFLIFVTSQTTQRWGARCEQIH